MLWMDLFKGVQQTNNLHPTSQWLMRNPITNLVQMSCNTMWRSRCNKITFRCRLCSLWYKIWWAYKFVSSNSIMCKSPSIASSNVQSINFTCVSRSKWCSIVKCISFLCVPLMSPDSNVPVDFSFLDVSFRLFQGLSYVNQT